MRESILIQIYNIFIPAIIFSILSIIYIFIFKKIFNKNKVPTGFGLVLPSYLIIFNKVNAFENSFSLSIFFIFLYTTIYFLDDVFNLKPLIRILIQILMGLSLIYIYSENIITFISPNLIPIIFLTTIVLTILLVNVLNFYDGADLSLCLIIFLSGLILSFSNNYNYENIRLLGSLLLSFSIGFGVINSRSKTIYLGDSGSFSIASIIIFIFIFSLFKLNYFPFEFICLLAFPIFDVFYVLSIRIIKKHDLLSRNYLHLYQRLQIKYKNFYYLIPALSNFIICLISFQVLFKIYQNLYVSLFIICFIITPTFYLTIRKRFIEKQYFFGDGS